MTIVKIYSTIMAAILIVACAGPQKLTTLPADQTNVRATTAVVLDHAAGAVYGAKSAESHQPPSPITDTVLGELALAEAVLPPPSPEQKAAADARVIAGLAGDVQKYKELSNTEQMKAKSALDDKRKAEDEAISLRAEKKDMQDALERERKDAADTKLRLLFGTAGAVLTVLGGLAAALGTWFGIGTKPGMWLLLSGLLVGTLAFVWGSVWFSGIVAIALVCGGYAIIDFYKQNRDAGLKQKTLQKVVKGIDDQKLDPKKDPLLVNLDGRMGDPEKALVKKIRGVT